MKENFPSLAAFHPGLDRPPILLAITGPNGAGKTTFFESHLKHSGLRFVNADVIAKELGGDPYEAARIAGAIRSELVRQRESFIFETVFSDPVGDKIAFLKEAAASGYSVAVIFIGLSTPALSMERVSIRVAQGGHDIPDQKLRERFPRVLANLAKAIVELPLVLLFDNSDVDEPFRLVATAEEGRIVSKRAPAWLKLAMATSRGRGS